MKPTYEQLEQVILELKAKIEQLEARLNKNSSNSSKPPSLDQKGNTPNNERPKKQGAHHPGASRQLLPAQMVTSREARGLDTCPRCHSPMEPTGESIKWQQVDLPQIKPLVHEIELLT